LQKIPFGYPDGYVEYAIDLYTELNEKSKKSVEELKEKYNLLPDFVLIKCIKQSLKNKGLEITQEMMDIKKLTILLKRELKQLNN
jgi:hypothetical protein